ncbi:unnamed protein product [Trichobilharzia regenti]|nr:unnamed protein product [Trichobilharzia regenti]
MPHDGDDLMERIQQIVNQQKSRCLDEIHFVSNTLSFSTSYYTADKVESPPSNGLNLNGFINGDHNAVESSNTSVIRKVIEGTAPSAYPGFCLVTGDQENILSNNNTCARSCKSDAKAQSLRHLHDTCPKNPCVRHVSAKIDPSRQDSAKRDLLLNNAHSRRQGQELIQKYLDAVSSESVDRQADVKKQCVPPDPTKHIGFECFTSMDNQLTANPDQNEPINNNNNKNLNANKNERLVCSSTAAPLMASKSKKGIFRPHVTKSAITKCTGMFMYTYMIMNIKNAYFLVYNPTISSSQTRKYYYYYSLRFRVEHLHFTLFCTVLFLAGCARLPIGSHLLYLIPCYLHVTLGGQTRCFQYCSWLVPIQSSPLV